MNTGFHGSFEAICSINDGGAFGGLFITPSRRAAMSHGDVLHVVESPRPLRDYALNYEIEGAYAIARELAGGDETLADAIMSARCEHDEHDGWHIQRLRGQLAARLGYTSVEMRDEHGTTWLALPGCTIRLAGEDDC